MNSVAGIPLESFEVPIRSSLRQYSDMTDGHVQFDAHRAAQLELTLEGPNSARSVTPVVYDGEEVASLFVIAFAPGDSTGQRTSTPITTREYVSYEAGAAILPQSKNAELAEAHLTIATASQERPHSDPILFAGNLSLMGMDEDKISQIGILGQQDHRFVGAAYRRNRPVPTATLTTGSSISGERFGDPHCVYNDWKSLVQICGFVAIGRDAPREHLNVLRLLRAAEPAQPR